MFLKICGPACSLAVVVSAWLPTGLNISGETFGLLGATGGVNTTLDAVFTSALVLTNNRGVPTATQSAVFTGEAGVRLPSTCTD